MVSAELVIQDKEFIQNANIKIKQQTSNAEFLIKEGDKPTVILAIISDKELTRPEIPFFSKIALRHTARSLHAYGCELYLKNIKKIKLPLTGKETK